MGVPQRTIGVSGANAPQTVSIPAAVFQRLKQITVKYSASVTVDVTVTLNSGAGAAYDTLLQTLSLAANTDGVFVPDGDIDLLTDDVVDVLAPAGGAGITSTIAIYTEVL